MYSEPSLEKPRLRIGVMLNSFNVEAWQAKILDDLVKAPYLQVALIIVNRATQGAPPRPWHNLKEKWPTLLYSLYHRIDRKRHQAEEKNAFARVDTQELLNGVDVLEVMPIQREVRRSFRGIGYRADQECEA